MSQGIDSIELRSAVMKRIRAFFYERGFIEVETPIHLKAPCMELHINAEPCGAGFLRTSPELFHKRLLAQGYQRIFELGKCFRQGERGALHHPEYTMLEWYRTSADYMDMLEETRLLIQSLSAVGDFGWGEWKVLTVSEAFLDYAGWNPIEEFDADRFDLDLVEKVEPALKAIGGPVVLMDYPSEVAALSKIKADDERVAERWELYINGIEMANAYSELTDADEQRCRFLACAEQRRAAGREIYPLDESFLDALGSMPPSGGVALGLDRLLMLMCGAESLDDVLPFRA